MKTVPRQGKYTQASAKRNDRKTRPDTKKAEFRKKYGINKEFHGASCRVRTDDLLITNQLLYQLS